VLTSPTKQCRRLSGIIKGGAAFHHAGLMPAQRKLIEENFKLGKIKFIVSTPTLAFGVNMPAYSVVIRDLKRFDSENYGSYYIPSFEVQQMMGRAGRPKYDKEGEAIIIAKTKHEAGELRSRYLTGDTEPIYSKLSSVPVLRLHVLGLVASQTAETKNQLEKFFSQTFFAHQYDDIDEVMERVQRILDELRSYRFIEYAEESFISSDFTPAFSLVDEKFRATKLGKRVAEMYIDPLSAKIMIDNMGAGNAIDYLTIISQCNEMSPMLRVKQSDDLEPSNMKIKVPDVWDVKYEDFLEAYKTALMLLDWTNEITEDKLLEKYGITPGELYNKTSNAEWLLYAAKELSMILNNATAANNFNRLRMQVKYGVKKELLELVSLRGIGRARARLLWKNNMRSISDVRKARKERLEEILGKKLAAQVLEQVHEDRYEKFAKIKMGNRN